MNNDTVLKAIALLFPTMNWITKDKDGSLYVFSTKPYISDRKNDMWNIDAGPDAACVSLTYILPYTNETDWTKTLVDLNDYRDEIDFEVVRVDSYGDEGITPLHFECENGSCLSSSGDSICGHFLNTVIINKKLYTHCVSVPLKT